MLRYTYNGIIKENFICFVNCHNIYNETETEDEDLMEKDPITFEPKLTGDILGEIVLNILKSFSLNLTNCVGIGTDGCSVMVSTLRGAVTKIQSHAPNAIHCPCSNHALNLAISKSSSLQAIRNCVGLMMEIISFFNLSSKRNFVLKKILNGNPRLISLCETRWVERHDSVMLFKSSLPYIIKALTLISNWQEHNSSSKAKMLLTSLCKCEFVVGIFSLSSFLCVTTMVSKLLQSKWQDICKANEIISDIILSLEKKRKNATTGFHELYIEIKKVMLDLDIEEKLLRLTSHQTKRANHAVDSIEEYYRVSVYIPLVENILSDMKARFCCAKNQAFIFLSKLIPKNIVNTTDEEITKIVQNIINYFKFDDAKWMNIKEIELKTEIDLWKLKWTRIQNEGKMYKLAFNFIDNIF